MNMNGKWTTLIGITMLAVIFSGFSNESLAAPSEEQDQHRGEEEHEGAIHIREEVQERLGISVVSVAMEPMDQLLEVTGQIAQDTDRFHHIHTPQSGKLAQIHVVLGERIEQGSLLAVVGTPEESSIQVVAPVSGLVIGIHKKLGDSVDTLTSLMTIADLSQVWSTLDLYEQDAGLVEVGQRIDVISVAYPDRRFPAKVIFVSPRVDQHTRTIKIRAQVENPDYALKLGMFITGVLYIPVDKKALVVPRSAIQKIENESVVFVRLESDEFELRKVQVGQQTREYAQILEGLQAGEQVVAEGSFHLKAELLKGSLEEGHAH